MVGDGVSQVYIVSILATFTGTTDENACVIWPGFYCYVNGILQRFATHVRIEEVTGRQVEFATGEAAPAGVSDGCHYWNIELEEVIPAGSSVSAEPETGFVMKFVTDEKTEEFSDCVWQTTSRAYSKEGLRRIHKGVALSRREVEDGQA